MPKTTVVNVKHEASDVYIGRPCRHRRGSPYANPFKVGRDGTREEVINKYRTWLLAQPVLMERACHELKGKRLGCWCKPLPCHGDVLVELIEGNP